jgi:hypothetical protein
MKNRALLFFHNRLDFVVCLIGGCTLICMRLAVGCDSPFQLIVLTSLWSVNGVYQLCHGWFALDYRSRPFKVFAVGFVLTFVVRQLFVRDALIPSNTYLSQNGEFVGGPLGEPNFEGIAIACVAGLCLLELDRAIEERLFSLRQIVRVGIRSLFAGIAAWIVVLGVYHLLVVFNILPDKFQFISKAIFEVSFGNPERGAYIPAIAALYVCAMLLSIRRYAPSRRP